MVIKNRLFPYPVLCEDTDDYTDGGFSAEVRIAEEGMNYFLLQFSVKLENSELRRLINCGKAKYIIHIECSNTAFRTMINPEENNGQYRIEKSRVNGNISLCAMIISTDIIEHYTNSALNEDYKGIELTIEKSSILAYCNMPYVNIKKNYEELSNSDSFFSIVKMKRMDINEHNPIEYDINSNRIKILVDEDIYNSYIRYKNNSTMQPIMLSLLVMPALTYMLEILRYKEDGYIEEFEDYDWFFKINESYKQNGKDFVEDVVNNQDKKISEIVQEMLGLPINKAMVSIQGILEE